MEIIFGKISKLPQWGSAERLAPNNKKGEGNTPFTLL
jgi:hypothetical protein